MKSLKWTCIILFAFQVSGTISLADEFKAKQPILLSSAGQNADVLMVKILATKVKLQFTYDKMAQPESLKNHASLILVSGGSAKGLGAAKIDKQQELDRVQAIINAAKNAKISIIIMHLGGQARRGKLSDEFNKLAAENADCLIVVKSGDNDQLFSKIAEHKKIPIYLIDKIMEAGNVMKNIFAPPAE